MVNLPDVAFDEEFLTATSEAGREQATKAIQAGDPRSFEVIAREATGQFRRKRQLEIVTEQRIGRDTPSEGQKAVQSERAAERSAQVQIEREQRIRQREQILKLEAIEKQRQSREAIGLQEEALRARRAPTGGLPSRVASPTYIGGELSGRGS